MAVGYEKEISALEDNNTWVMNSLPLRKKTLGCKWVYKIKYDFDGSVECLKARKFLAIDHQVEEINYNETLALVAKMVTVHTFLAVVATQI